MFSGQKTKGLLALFGKAIENSLTTWLWTDSLTSLPNQAAYCEAMEEHLKIIRQVGRTIYLLFIEINHFKNTNTLFGEHIGDEVLRTLARILKKMEKCFNSKFFRRGGDEFTGIILEKDIKSVTDEIIKNVQQHELPEKIKFTVSIGCVQLEKNNNMVDLEHKAWLACLAAKRQEGNSIYHYDENIKSLSDSIRLRGHCAKCQTNVYFNVSQQIAIKQNQITFSCPICCKKNIILRAE